MQVSTLTQPQGRVQRLPQNNPCKVNNCFNPHPTSRPGATNPGRDARSRQTFQPSPNLKAGCNSYAVVRVQNQPVFQPSPNLKAGCNVRMPDNSWTEVVSTLTQPQGRVQLTLSIKQADCLSFNPHPTSRPGATIDRYLVKLCCLMFQPSPNLKAGCNVYGGHTAIAADAFQPSPNLKAGCNDGRWNTNPLLKMFQPSPNLKAGCNICLMVD